MVGSCSGGKSKNRLCLREIIGLLYPATGSATSRRASSDNISKGNKVKTGMLSFSHSASLTTFIQMLIPKPSVFSARRRCECKRLSLSPPLSASPCMTQRMAAVCLCGSGTMNEKIHGDTSRSSTHIRCSRHGAAPLALTVP